MKTLADVHINCECDAVQHFFNDRARLEMRHEDFEILRAAHKKCGFRFGGECRLRELMIRVTSSDLILHHFCDCYYYYRVVSAQVKCKIYADTFLCWCFQLYDRTMSMFCDGRYCTLMAILCTLYFFAVS